MFPHNLDKPVPITPCLFMDETQRVVHFMLNCSFIHAPIFHQAHCLASSNFPKVGPAAKNRQSITKMITLSTYKEMDVLVMPPRASRCAGTEGAMQSHWCEISSLPEAAKLHRGGNKASEALSEWYMISYLYEGYRYDKWSSLSS